MAYQKITITAAEVVFPNGTTKEFTLGKRQKYSNDPETCEQIHLIGGVLHVEMSDTRRFKFTGNLAIMVTETATEVK